MCVKSLGIYCGQFIVELIRNQVQGRRNISCNLEKLLFCWQKFNFFLAYATGQIAAQANKSHLGEDIAHAEFRVGIKEKRNTTWLKAPDIRAPRNIRLCFKNKCQDEKIVVNWSEDPSSMETHIFTSQV